MKTTRTTISIPIDIKKEMRKFPHVNWSKVAVRAFVNHMSSEHDIPSVEEIFERLKVLETKVL